MCVNRYYPAARGPSPEPFGTVCRQDRQVDHTHTWRIGLHLGPSAMQHFDGLSQHAPLFSARLPIPLHMISLPSKLCSNTTANRVATVQKAILITYFTPKPLKMSDREPRKRDRLRMLIRARQPESPKIGPHTPTAASSSLNETTAPSEVPTSSAQHPITPTESPPKLQPPGGAIGDATFKPNPTSQIGPTSTTAAAHTQVGSKREQPTSTTAGSTDSDAQSLWSRAINSKELSSYRKTLEDIDFDVDSLKTASAIKSWMDEILSKNKGEDGVLRDVGTKILHCVDRFKQIGDTIVQYDPAHAALPWAGFRFLLQVGLNR